MSKIYKIFLTLLISVVIFLSASESFIASQEVNNTSSGNISNLTGGINSTINSSTYKQSTWGILVQDQNTSEVIFEENSQELFVPGSTTKIFVAAAALAAYGPDYKFQTPVYYDGDLESGTLQGNLVLVASGDLTMGGRNTPDGKIAYTNLDHSDANSLDGANLTSTDPLAGLNDLARQVKASGINRVEGDVIIDDRLFNKTLAPSGDYLITPIMINDNLIDLEIVPGKTGENATINWRPQSSTYTVTSQVQTISSGQTEITINSEDKNNILVEGQILENSTPLVRTVTVEDPSSFARALFIEALNREGVEVTSPSTGQNQELLSNNTTAYTEDERVALLTSLPFSENIKLVLKVSHNMQADTLVALLALKNGNKTFDKGMQLVGDFLEGAGVDTDTLALSDGRGGAYSDRISPEASNQLLSYMTQQSYYQSFFDALPVLGYDGSLAGVVTNSSPIYGKVNAKTGTTIAEDKLNNRDILLSKSLAGYMVTSSGRKLIFSIYVNNVPLNSTEDVALIEQDINQVLEAIYYNI
ncbi:MAG: D-alanyl-D-alanine carboxypeptidase/D-alanyl-D-alanine-endopeptidase [Methanobacteriaceae archaeon]